MLHCIVKYLANIKSNLFNKCFGIRWRIPLYVINAAYAMFYNRMFIPSGIIQRPFYHSRFSIPYNYGAIGSVLGHELTHGFDDKGNLKQ